MKILICGSGYSISQVDNWDLSTHTVIAVNNAWARVKWNYFCCPDDYKQDYNKMVGFPHNLIPVDLDSPKSTQNWYNQIAIELAIKRAGGGTECGYSVVLGACYTTIEHFKDRIQSIGLVGCDLVYSMANNKNNTAYYGRGVDYDKRDMSDPEHMANIMRILRREEINTTYNKRWGNLTNDEMYVYLFTRLATYAKKKYNIEMFNYSNSESKLPYTRRAYS